MEISSSLSRPRILASIPITALVILFDIIVHDPRRQDTAINLAVLDIGSGHFSRIEYRSGGYLPGSLISEFAHIARDYVNDMQSKNDTGTSKRKFQTMSGLVVPSASLPQTRTTVGGTDDHLITEGAEVGLGNNLVSSSVDQLGQDMERSLQGSQQDSSETVDLFDMSGFFPTGFEDPTMMEGLTGTDVMGIFNNSLPDLDPAIFNWD